MSSSSSSSSGSELTDYDSSSSLEVFVSPRKLKEELKKELEKEKKIAAEKGLPTYKDGTSQKFDKKGGLRSEQIVRLERINKKRRSMRAQVMRNIARHLQRPSVRQAYNFFTREIPPENDLYAELTRRKIRVTADEDTMRVTIIQSPLLPY